MGDAKEQVNWEWIARILEEKGDDTGLPKDLYGVAAVKIATAGESQVWEKLKSSRENK